MLTEKDVKPLRDKLLKEQGNVCKICKEPYTRWSLDHQHAKRIGGSGLVRGVLCNRCNLLVGACENTAKRHFGTVSDLPVRLRNIADFLEESHLPFIHPSEMPKTKPFSKRVFNKLAKLYKERYPNKKGLTYPKSGKTTKQLKELTKEFNL